MKLDNKVVFVTGANRGIGKAIVEALLKQPIKKIYAAARNPEKLPPFNDARVVPVKLDITNREQINAAATQAKDVDVLINNAGVLTFTSAADSDTQELQHDMAVNYFGTLSMVRAFIPILEARGGGAVANVISVAGLACALGIVGYSASKAALFSSTQALRAELAQKNITVHGIFPGPIETDMTKDFDMEKTSAAETGQNIVKGLLEGQEDIFPDPMSQEFGKLWGKDPRAAARQLAGLDIH